MTKFKVTVTRTTVNNSVLLVYANNDIEARNIAEGELEGDYACLYSTSNTKNTWNVEEVEKAQDAQNNKMNNNKKEKK